MSRAAQLILVLSACLFARISAQLCDDFSVAKCHPDEVNVLGLYPSEDAEQCQELCFINEDNGCLFFEYASDAEVFERCLLLKARHTHSCEFVTGPVSPAVLSCVDNDVSQLDPCDQYIEHGCTMDNDSVFDDDLVVSSDDCQLVLEQFIVFASYFSYDSTLAAEKCKLFDSSARTCTGFSGPLEPSIAECPNKKWLKDFLRK